LFTDVYAELPAHILEQKEEFIQEKSQLQEELFQAKAQLQEEVTINNLFCNSNH
jgi:hypothetical protein